MSAPYRFAPAVPKKPATGLVARVYAQMSEEFLLADGPLMSLSPAPEVLAATWALLREAEIVGTASRAEKEAVASAVAFANRCPFCTEAHALLIHGAGGHRLAETVRLGGTPDDPRQAELVRWAKAGRTPGADVLAAPPVPPEQAAEFLGTVLVSHFINRMVTSLLDEEALLPQAVRSSRLVRRAVGCSIGAGARRQPPPGRSLELLAAVDPGTGAGFAPPAWADEGPIGVAHAALRGVADAGGALLGGRARAVVREVVAAWDGSHADLGTAWLDTPLAELPAGQRPAARLALLAGLAPYRLTEADVASWRDAASGAGAGSGDDGDLVRVLAFGAMAAVARVEEWTTAAFVSR